MVKENDCNGVDDVEDLGKDLFENECVYSADILLKNIKLVYAKCNLVVMFDEVIMMKVFIKVVKTLLRVCCSIVKLAY